MKQKYSIIGLFTFLLVGLLAGSAQAVFMACFHQGEHINFCNPAIDDRTASTDFYFICMSQYLEDQSCYVHASLNSCNSLPPGNGQCNNGQIGNGSNIDTVPPILTIINPNIDNSSVFTSASVLLAFNTNEDSDVFYADLSDDRLRDSKICDDCIGDKTKSVRFDEGLNKIRFKAVDVVGNARKMDVAFYIDSKDPRITKTEPTRGFADGNFMVEFVEDNPVELFLTIGNNNQEHQIDIENDCTPSGNGRQTCNTFFDLTPFNNNDIDYWFTLVDIAGNSHEGKHATLKVDTSDPIFVDVDFDVDGKNTLFDISLIETNFANLFYHDKNDPKSKPKSLCSKLVGGTCIKSASFADGFHMIVLNATDAAGNDATEEASFFTDTKVPKFTSTSPNKGFADGTFEAMVDEANPISLFLNYGNNDVGFRSALVDHENDCNAESRGKRCTQDVNLNDYNGMSILYWFNMTDVIGQSANSKKTNVSVDTIAPIINSLTTNTVGRAVTFTISITDATFESVEYSDNGASPKLMCSTLVSGVCSKKLTFMPGHHNVNIQVTDKAGNAIGQMVSFVIV